MTACSWCGNPASHHVVFGSLTTMEIWDVMLCAAHKEQCESNIIRFHAVYAPLNVDQYAPLWADMMEASPRG